MKSEIILEELGNLVEIKGGKRLPKGTKLSKEKTNHPYIRVKDMHGQKNLRITPDFEYVTEDVFNAIKKYTVSKNDIILSIVGTIGLVSKISESLDGANLTENCVKLINFKNIDEDYLYYYLSSEIGQHEIYKGIVGSTQPKLPIYNIKKVKVPMREIKEQKAIANILSTLDEKIETNNQINEKLEEMAQALFKHWFVDFEFPNENGEPYKSSGGEMVESELGMIPKGWNVVTLEKIAELIMGLSPKSSTYNEDGIGLPLLNGAADFDKNNLRPSRFTSDPKRVSKKEDWLLCIRGTIGNLTFSDGDYALGRGVAAIRAKESMYREIIYFNLQKSIKELISLASGSVISGLSKQDINNLKIITPDKKILTVFHNLIHKIQQEQIDLKSQNKVLSKIRDILLPKLMSGEIRVPLDDEVLSEKN